MLDLLYETSDLRPVHPTDQVEIWLDQKTMVPLDLSFTPADSSKRVGCGRSAKVSTTPKGDPIWRCASKASTCHPSPITVPGIPPQATVEDHGFRATDDLVGPEPAFVPEGMRVHQMGKRW